MGAYNRTSSPALPLLLRHPINYKAVPWIIAVYHVSQKTITIYNSAGGDSEACLQGFPSCTSAHLLHQPKAAEVGKI